MLFINLVSLFACAAYASSTTNGAHHGHLTTISAGDKPITTTIPAHTETLSAKTQIFSAKTHVQKAHNVTLTHKAAGGANHTITQTEEVREVKPTTHVHPRTTKTRPATTKSYPAAMVTVQPHHQAVVYSAAETVAVGAGAVALMAGVVQVFALL